MSKLKKVLLMCTACVLVAALAIGGTLAYLQAEDSDVNVMTLGNVKIEQIEQERDANGNLIPFSQAKPAYPAVGTIAWDETTLEVNGIGYKVFDDNLKNVVDKIVTVNNTGKTAAYVRTIVAIEAPEGDPNDLIHFNWNNTGIKLEGGFITKIDDTDYYIISFVYTDALAAGAKSAPSLMQVFLDSKATNEDCAKFGETWDILVLSQAVQAAGFGDAQTALDTAYGKIEETNTPWNNYGFNPPEIANNSTSLSQDLILFEDPLINTMDQNGFTFEGNGHTVEVQDIGGEIDTTGTIPMSGIVFSSKKGGNPVVVNDVTITGTFQMVTAGNYVQGKQKRTDFNTTFNNVNIVDAELIYFSNNGFTAALTAYGTLAMNNCNVTDNKISAASSVDAPVYDMAVTNQTNVTIDKCEIGSMRVWNQAWVTINNSKIDVIDSAAITANDLGKLVIGADSEVGTINLIPGKYAPALVIEAGATVGEINYNGVTYTQAEWMAR